MMVAVALVMLLMMLFAQVFQMAGGSVSTQRGLMENDQRARSVQTLIQGDLTKRTFQKVIPFAFNEDLTAPEAELSYRRGYFYISENDPATDSDDVLAFTVTVTAPANGAATWPGWAGSAFSAALTLLTTERSRTTTGRDWPLSVHITVRMPFSSGSETASSWAIRRTPFSNSMTCSWPRCRPYR